MQTGGSCNFCYACGFKNTPAPITVPITVDKAVKIPSYVLIHFLFLLLLLAWLDILPSLVPFHTIANPKSIKTFWMWFLFYTVSTNFSFSFPTYPLSSHLSRISAKSPIPLAHKKHLVNLAKILLLTDVQDPHHNPFQNLV